MPLANAFLTQERLNEPEPTYPLEVVFCSSCSLVQLTVSVPPEQIFREYLYFSSFSDAMLRHSQNVVQRLISERELDEGSLVVEVASNDGYLLQYFVESTNTRACVRGDAGLSNHQGTRTVLAGSGHHGG